VVRVQVVAADDPFADRKSRCIGERDFPTLAVERSRRIGYDDAVLVVVDTSDVEAENLRASQPEMQSEGDNAVKLAADGVHPHTRIWRAAILYAAKPPISLLTRQFRPSFVERRSERS
jgi:hypothetical protein